jgi:multiple sugar transport system permease protein
LIRTTRKKYSLKAKEARLGWLFVLPALIGFSIFTFGAIIRSLYYSFTDWDLLTKPKFVGLKNYIDIFTNDKYFYKYMGNTFFFVITLVPIVLVFSLLLAVLINKKSKGLSSKIYRVILFLPSITSTIAVSMVWMWIFNPNMGLINNILGLFGLKGPNWLNDPSWAKPALVIMRVWQMSGYYMIMFLTGLQTIPGGLYEAAKIDGANKAQSFFRITIPMLANTTFAVVIMLVVEAFNMFESIFIMTSGGPLGSTSTMMYYIYEKSFIEYKMGYASALSWIFFIIIFIITLIQYKFRNEREGE